MGLLVRSLGELAQQYWMLSLSYGANRTQRAQSAKFARLAIKTYAEAVMKHRTASTVKRTWNGMIYIVFAASADDSVDDEIGNALQAVAKRGKDARLAVEARIVLATLRSSRKQYAKASAVWGKVAEQAAASPREVAWARLMESRAYSGARLWSTAKRRLAWLTGYASAMQRMIGAGSLWPEFIQCAAAIGDCISSAFVWVPGRP